MQPLPFIANMLLKGSRKKRSFLQKEPYLDVILYLGNIDKYYIYYIDIISAHFEPA